MTRLSKDFRLVSSPQKWNDLWNPLNASLDTSMKQTDANRYSKHFYGQNHLKTLVLFHMTDGKSLEDLHHMLEHDLRFKLYAQCPSVSKSQLSRCNAKRPVEAFHRVFGSLVDQLPARASVPRSLTALMHRTKVFDGTFIALNRNYYPWAIYRTQYREPSSGVRMTLRLDLHSHAPDRVFIHPYRDNSANYFRACVDFTKKGLLYVFDREYTHYGTFEDIHTSGNFFITPLKCSAHCEVLEERAVPQCPRHGFSIMKDQIILIGRKYKERISSKLRRIEAVDQEGNLRITVTNIFDRAASTIIRLYQMRWHIEVFFKWIKQHLKIKRFISYSVNGIFLQIYAALILYVLLALFKFFNNVELSLYDLMRRLKAKMMTITPIICVTFEKAKVSQSVVKERNIKGYKQPVILMQH